MALRAPSATPVTTESIILGSRHYIVVGEMVHGFPNPIWLIAQENCVDCPRQMA